jgi:hypothetical protein
VRGFEDRSMPVFQLRIEHAVWNGVPATFVYAHPDTHRMFRWGHLLTSALRDHPEGVVDMEPRMVRDAFGRGLADDAEVAALLAHLVDPQPPDRPTRLRLVS